MFRSSSHSDTASTGLQAPRLRPFILLSKVACCASELRAALDSGPETAETAIFFTGAACKPCNPRAFCIVLAVIVGSALGRPLAPLRRMPVKHIVYILRSVPEPKRPYIGLTHGVDARLTAHNAGRCAHTARYRPWGLVAAIILADERTAIRFERYLKSGSGRAFAKRHFEP
jgi:putative endonuclease